MALVGLRCRALLRMQPRNAPPMLPCQQYIRACAATATACFQGASSHQPVRHLIPCLAPTFAQCCQARASLPSGWLALAALQRRRQQATLPCCGAGGAGPDGDGGGGGGVWVGGCLGWCGVWGGAGARAGWLQRQGWARMHALAQEQGQTKREQGCACCRGTAVLCAGGWVFSNSAEAAARPQAGRPALLARP